MSALLSLFAECVLGCLLRFLSCSASEEPEAEVRALFDEMQMQRQILDE